MVSVFDIISASISQIKDFTPNVILMSKKDYYLMYPKKIMNRKETLNYLRTKRKIVI